MVITELRKQKGKKNMFSVFVDGQFVCSLDDYTVFKHKLCENQETNKQILEDMQCESMSDLAFSQSVDLLSKMMKTEKQMREYLHKKGYLKKVVDQVVEKLKEYRYLNDTFYAECFIRQKINSVGKFKIKNELKLKGVDENIISELLEQVDNQDEVILQLANKYVKNKPIDSKTVQKLSRFLASKGFSWDEINSCLNKMNKETNYEDWE